MSHAAELTDQAHGHDDHGHMPFLAHHFDDPEQQYDSGKLGMWLFLVTEVLFFSGMFCAYALYRSIHPEIFTFASQFLNETLGAFNTGVLLFSSLTMAWGVRCAQLRQHKGLVVCLAMTLGCAAIFLGVKAIEYTHKWDLGLLPAGLYESQYLPGAHHEGISQWLIVLSIVPALCVLGFAGWYGFALVKGEKGTAEIAGPLLVTALCYFVGVSIGLAFQSAEEAAHAKAAHGSEHAGGEHGTSGGTGTAVDDHEHAGDSDSHGSDSHGSDSHGSDSHGATAVEAEVPGLTAGTEMKVVEPDGSVIEGEPAGFSSVLVSTGGQQPVIPGAVREGEVDQAGGAGLFFSIYYCMTGVHAIHILGGMVVLTWLLVRATKNHFNEEYFGPVDYVGLYWHLVDLIWIYLFPLLYLIT